MRICQLVTEKCEENVVRFGDTSVARFFWCRFAAAVIHFRVKRKHI